MDGVGRNCCIRMIKTRLYRDCNTASTGEGHLRHGIAAATRGWPLGVDTRQRDCSGDGNGRARRSIWHVNDITEQKRLQDEFIQRNAVLLQKAVEQAEELDKHNKELQQVNAALTIVLKQRQEDKGVLEERLSENVLQLIEPLVKRLQRTNWTTTSFALSRTSRRTCATSLPPLSPNLPHRQSALLRWKYRWRLMSNRAKQLKKSPKYFVWHQTRSMSTAKKSAKN